MLLLDMPDSSFDFQIAVPEDFHYELCLDYLGRSPEECSYEIHGKAIRKVLSLRKRLGLIEINYLQGTGLNVSVLAGGPINAGERAEISQLIRDWFDLERDLLPFYKLAKQDDILSRVVGRYYGLRLIGVPDLFEALCWAVLGQQINLSFAYTLKKRITHAYGDALEYNGSRYYRFPTPEELLQADPADLGAIQVSRSKAAALLEIARQMERGELSRNRLLNQEDYEQMGQTLMSIKGVGPWTAHYVRMRCLGDAGAFPIGDAGLHNAVKHILGLAAKPTTSQLQELFSAWKGWEAYATFYLWRTLY